MKSTVRLLGNSQFQHPDAVLEAARNVELQYVVVIGWDRNDELYVVGSDTDLGEFLVAIEAAKALMLRGSIPGPHGDAA